MGEPRQFSVHLALGGGALANVLLWKKPYQSFAVLVVSTTMRFMIERAGYNLLSIITNSVFYLSVLVFFWAKSAVLLNRPLPPLPKLKIPEERLEKAADKTRQHVNRALSMAHDIAIGGNMKLAIELAVVLWFVSYIGSLLEFVSLLYIGVLLSLCLPVLYENHQRLIDKQLSILYKLAQIQYRIIDENILSKIQLPAREDKTMW